MNIFTLLATIVVGALMIAGLSYALDIEPAGIMLGSIATGGEEE